MIIIADAGPILHLYWIHATDWGLPSQEIVVVESVWAEVARTEPHALQDRRLLRTSDPPIHGDRLLEALDLGERAAISLALDHPACLVLCDDRKARRACTELAIKVIGSVGLILDAAREGRTPYATAEWALRALPGRGRLHVSPTLIQKAIDELHRGTAR